jgi:rhodanese-related sulfurtransferase
MKVQTLAPAEVYRRRQDGKPIRIIDVRTPVEFAELHAEGAQLIPLDKLNPGEVMSAEVVAHPDTPLCVICKSGGRAAKAVERFHAAGFPDVVSIEGGTDGWEQAGLPVVRGAAKVISLERQVRIAAGTIVLVGNALGWHFHPLFHAISAFIGAGLLFAGVSDWCGMGLLLAKMPWNNPKAARSTAESESPCSS